VIVNRIAKTLLAPEISLDRNLPEQEVNLI